MLDYEKMISSFLKQGYEPAFFDPSPKKEGSLILRHDVDFDIEYAYKLSRIEDKLGVKATYFFLMSSKSYNLIERANLDRVRSMISSGHNISIHFDPTHYEDMEEGFQKEKELFEQVFDMEVQCISIHRPPKYFLNNAITLGGVRHTYQPIYFDQIKYFADSQGQFRFGHPLESEEFGNKHSIQLLIHPLWWVTEGLDPISQLHEFLDYRVESFKQHMALNCTPYRQYLENIN